MAHFPMFIDISEKQCVVVGGGKVASRKIEVLLEFCSKIKVISPELTEELQKLAYEGKIEHITRGFNENDLEGAIIAIAATSCRDVNNRIYKEACARGIYINVADSLEESNFVFPAIVKREEIVVGISTSGGFPSLTKKLREKIQEIIPKEYGTLLGKYVGKRREIIARGENKEEQLELLTQELNSKFTEKTGFYEKND